MIISNCWIMWMIFTYSMHFSYFVTFKVSLNEYDPYCRVTVQILLEQKDDHTIWLIFSYSWKDRDKEIWSVRICLRHEGGGGVYFGARSNELNHARNKRRCWLLFYQNYVRYHLYSTIWSEVIRASGKWDYSMSLEIMVTYLPLSALCRTLVIYAAIIPLPIRRTER